MDNAYVQMIVDGRNKLGISTSKLCEGICTAEHFYQVEQGKRDIGRALSERLLARLGIDSGNYEHYLDYPDYEKWRSRMRIINSIEDNQIEKAERFLNEYQIYCNDVKNANKVKLEKQFSIFMNMQIIKHEIGDGITEEMQEVYEEALKLTVPNIDKKPINELALSSLELILVLEYKRLKYVEASVKEKWDFYEEIFQYIHMSPLGKVSLVKVYPKVFVYMYRDIAPMIDRQYDESSIRLHEELFTYCEQALGSIRQRKFIYYLTEILEIKLELLKWFEDNAKEIYKLNGYREAEDETEIHLENLKGLYKEYDIDCYMHDDCYLYRESGVYCINEVIKARRVMLGLTQADLAGNDIAETTIWRIEAKKQAVTHKVTKKLFERLNLYPSCINMGIVTDKKEELQLYEELRFALNSFKLEEVKKLLDKLKTKLSEHKINKQILLCIEGRNELWLGNIDKIEYTKRLMEALECTISLDYIKDRKEIFLTTEELTAIYLISEFYKGIAKEDTALMYIKEVLEYCKGFEKKEIVDGRMGIYEMVMAYVASLYGDIGRYEESNCISENLIRISLKLKRSNRIHSNMYNIAWNNDASKRKDYDYNSQVQRCIHISRLLGDTNDERFYYENLKPTE